MPSTELSSQVSSATVLTEFERCQRSGYWTPSWQRHRMSPMQMIHESIRRAITEENVDPGENAGSHFVTLAAERGLDMPGIDTYRAAINHAAIADLIVTSLKVTEPWTIPAPVGDWRSSCFVHDGVLRRILCVSHWTEEREIFERISWRCAGEIAHYNKPMQLVVAVIGHMSYGRRQGHWSKGLLHPQGSKLRFKLKARSTVDGFKETWQKIYREEFDKIDKRDWLQAMLEDGVLQDSLFIVNLEVPPYLQCQSIRDLAAAQLNRLGSVSWLPAKQLSTCFDPLSPCQFRTCCHADPETHPGRTHGFFHL
jgi:hypothetical protein